MNSSSKIIENGWKDKKVREGYALSAICFVAAGVLYLSKQHFLAEYTAKLTNILLFVNVCHHTFMGINDYPKL
ncbi:MAG: hypothetical protein V1886_03615 [archaeon]